MGGEGFKNCGREFKFKCREYILLCYQGERNRTSLTGKQHQDKSLVLMRKGTVYLLAFQ